jgi:hypothetical protein
MISTTRRPVRRPVAIALSILVAAIAVWACGGGDGDGDADASGGSATGSALPQGSEPVNIDPAEFTTDIDNPYWPMKPGSRWVYREVHSEDLTVEKVVVTVTSETKKIANGVTARVVRDVVSENGVPTEVTDDWYAQDNAGNIWYMGEATTEYVDGKPKTTAGSFEAGVDGAQPGIIMPADPKPGLTYREEYYEGEAEDAARIVSLGEQAEPPAGHFPNALMTRNINPLEPKVLEFKFYAKGVGPVSTVGVSGGSKLEELVSYSLG